MSATIDLEDIGSTIQESIDAAVEEAVDNANIERAVARAIEEANIGLSKERIRQICERALGDLRRRCDTASHSA